MGRDKGSQREGDTDIYMPHTLSNIIRTRAIPYFCSVTASHVVPLVGSLASDQRTGGNGEKKNKCHTVFISK